MTSSVQYWPGRCGSSKSVCTQCHTASNKSSNTVQTIVKQRLGWGHPPPPPQMLDMATKSNQNKAVGGQYTSNSNTSLTLGLYSLSGSMFVVLAVIKAPAWCALVCQSWQIHPHCAHWVSAVGMNREREREAGWWPECIECVYAAQKLLLSRMYHCWWKDYTVV